MTAVWLVLGLAAAAPADSTAQLQVQARALVAASEAALARGDYEAALVQAQQAFSAHERLQAHAEAAWDLNTVGMANQYLSRYTDALDAYRRALDLDRASGSVDGEITRLNNIGNVHFLRGRYSDALQLYQEALQAVQTRATDKARARLRRMTLSNLAALNQRLGADERALDIYAQLSADETMRPNEEAQLLVNQGALMRRLGDPVKALGLYRSAQQLFARAAHRDGEISAWRNIGIAYALDLNDYSRALEAFDTALRLARESDNERGKVQALLYRGEVLRRLNRAPDALDDLQRAFTAAAATGLVEDQWKALYSIGLLHDAAGERSAARDALERAIATIESVRSDLRSVALRSEFLADKRDVYDALIWLRAGERPAPVGDLFRLMEQSRARTWQDRLQANAAPPSLTAVQARLAAGTLLVEYSVGAQGTTVVWATRSGAGAASHASHGDAARPIDLLARAVQHGDAEWRTASAAAGAVLLRDLPPLDRIAHLQIVADTALQFVPFEVLTVPGSRDLVIERAAVSYLPSAAYLLRPRRTAGRRSVWPWQRAFVAFGDPAPAAAYPLETRPIAPLPYARQEVERVAGELGGRSEVHVGDDARKALAVDGRLRAVPLVLFSTHAITDTRDPDRSRILLAPEKPGAPADYLFLREIEDLDLAGVGVVALSACSTERGKVVRGEGVEGFSRALLAAGAATAVTTLWDVADRPAAEFMTQFSFGLGRGEAPAGAMRSAKLRFIRSGQAWAHPLDWAGYVLTGEGLEPLPRVIPWQLLAAIAVFAGVLVIVALRAAVLESPSRPPRHTAG
ncbi:MAG TPA: CHAT domain-containing protein [Vicinamibacterales bacterium]|nr:CHAT domain-containing protein [Vicinamibacterales bacterium]